MALKEVRFLSEQELPQTLPIIVAPDLAAFSGLPNHFPVDLATDETLVTEWGEEYPVAWFAGQANRPTCVGEGYGFFPQGWARIDGVWQPLGFRVFRNQTDFAGCQRVVYVDNQGFPIEVGYSDSCGVSIGARGNPFTVVYTGSPELYGQWLVVPEEYRYWGEADFGGFWCSRTLGCARKVIQDVVSLDAENSQTWLVALAGIEYVSRARVKAAAVKVLRSVKLRGRDRIV